MTAVLSYAYLSIILLGIDHARECPNDCGDENEKENYVQVDGEEYHIEHISEDLVARMTTKERESYGRRFCHLWR